MNSRSKYKTKQKDILLEYLKKLSGSHVTACDVCDYFKEIGAPIGKSTIYRQLESLVDEGVINKYIIEPNSPACFEYVGKESHHEHECCFHCKCEKCGKLIHMHCEELEEIQWSVGAEYIYHDQFSLRAGYHHQAESKGNLKYFTIGGGFRMNVFSLDVGYVISTARSNPLDQTLRFTLAFDMDGLKDLFK